MKNLFTTSKTEAIKLGKEILRTDNNVKRLPYTNIKGSSLQCNCGETYAVRVYAKIKGEFPEITIGVCTHCAELQDLL